ncbi:MAG: pirin family protein [Microthrixaceae bacterium]
MPAVTVDDTLTLPRLPEVPAESRARPVSDVVTAHAATEGAGFEIRRPFPGGVDLVVADPFLLLDHIGPKVLGAREPKGAPWHPHRGFETVTYVLDGELAHQDTNGGGGVISEGDTQWMTAGGGIMHDELPTESFWRSGGAMHAVQLWVNLPPALKMTDPRYQAITAGDLLLLTTSDGGALIRLVAGSIAGHDGPGATHTPITYAHVTLAPGARLEVPWTPEFNALVYGLTGRGSVGEERVPLEGGRLAMLGDGDHVDGDHVTVTADAGDTLDVLLLGGLPIRAPIATYGPFVMNTRAEIAQAFEDYQAGRLGVIPAGETGPRSYR